MWKEKKQPTCGNLVISVFPLHFHKNAKQYECRTASRQYWGKQLEPILSLKKQQGSPDLKKNLYISIYIYIYLCMCIYLNVYIYLKPTSIHQRAKKEMRTHKTTTEQSADPHADWRGHHVCIKGVCWKAEKLSIWGKLLAAPNPRRINTGFQCLPTGNVLATILTCTLWNRTTKGCCRGRKLNRKQTLTSKRQSLP